MRAIVLFFLISGMLTACNSGDTSTKKNSHSGNPKTKTLQIVTSIKPVQAIVTAIAGDKGNVIQLIPDYASPHDYNLKPSDIRKINTADVIFRIDEHMEVLLNSAFQNSDTDVTVFSLAEIEDLKLIGTKDLHEKQGSNNHDEHSHGEVDFHIWASPQNALIMAASIAKELTKLNPSQATLYQDNLQVFTTQINDTLKEIKTSLTSLKKRPYVVFHDSWRYYANEFGLMKPLVVNAHEGINSGAKTLRSIRSNIIENDISCIFSDNSVSLEQLQVLTENTNMQVIELDVLTKGIENTPSTYVLWLKRFSKQIKTCLSV